MNPDRPYLSDEIQVDVDENGDVQVSQPDVASRRPGGFTKTQELTLDHPGMNTDPSLVSPQGVVSETDQLPRYPNGKVMLGSAALRAIDTNPSEPIIPRKTARERGLDEMALVEARRQIRARRGW